ncbi:head-tail connector protein [Roseobacter sp. HKCCA0434]|uniref:head-tail connector protein n=1 Tax=Roseobacter sp. HKCCA0434 TaxID=3079297 RepID=UPI002905D877|nr:head-tail connector protein [Roseobacter sp. HKCCA0434]
MILTERTGPGALPVALGDFSDHLRMGTGFADDGAEDAALEMYLRAATAAVEARIGKALITRALRLELTDWRGSHGLAIAPLAGVEAVRVIDAGGTAREMSGWRVVRDAHRPMVEAALSVPTGGRVEIDFTAGYGAEPADVPADLRQAVLLLAASYYENRSGSEAHWPFGVLALLDAHRPVRL